MCDKLFSHSFLPTTFTFTFASETCLLNQKSLVKILPKTFTFFRIFVLTFIPSTIHLLLSCLLLTSFQITRRRRKYSLLLYRLDFSYTSIRYTNKQYESMRSSMWYTFILLILLKKRPVNGRSLEPWFLISFVSSNLSHDMK